MKYTIHINHSQDTIYIPPSIQKHNIIQISCADDITNINTIKYIINCVNQLHPNTKIHIDCKMIEHLETILPKIHGLKIRINTSEDFEKFLQMDNHLNPQDTDNKDLNIIVQPNIEINNCKPSDLPLIWKVTQL